MRLRLLVSTLLLGLVAGCGQAVGEGGSAGGPEEPVEVLGRALVLEDRSHGPQLCLGGVMDSYPPQCGGPDLLGWDWTAVTGSERAGEAHWGNYVVVGFYDPTTGTLRPTRPPKPYDPHRFSRNHNTDVSGTPCPEPDGGWRVVNPQSVSEEHMYDTFRAARARADFGHSFVDQSINPAFADGFQPRDQFVANDPRWTIINVFVTGDPAEAREDLRQVWGGPLCVGRAEHTHRELMRIDRQLSPRSIPGFLSSGVVRDEVGLYVVWDDGGRQHRMNQRFGEGMVDVDSALEPYRR